MSDEAIKRALAAQNTLAKHSRLLDMTDLAARSPVLDAVRSLHENFAIKQMLADVERSQAMIRMATGPLEDLRRAGLFDHGSVLARTMADFSARFRLPETADAARLMEQFSSSPAAEALNRYAEQTSSFQRAIESMRTPWLDMQEPMRSMGGFAALQGIGHALNSMPAFGDHLGSVLRVDLGDWRDTITWPTEIFTDLGARSDFYVARGFDTALTDFPAPAFEESLEIAGLRGEPLSLVEWYGSPIPTINEDEEEGLTRTNTAHDWLLRLETQVRRLIDEEMTKAFGPDWPKHRLPNGLYDKWQEKKRNAQQSGGREWALIAYADFTDYVPVICKRDNWSVFAPFFGRQEDVRETFQRLHPIRLDTMHARPITKDDELLLYVETRRLVKVMIEKK